MKEREYKKILRRLAIAAWRVGQPMSKRNDTPSDADLAGSLSTARAKAVYDEIIKIDEERCAKTGL